MAVKLNFTKYYTDHPSFSFENFLSSAQLLWKNMVGSYQTKRPQLLLCACELYKQNR